MVRACCLSSLPWAFFQNLLDMACQGLESLIFQPAQLCPESKGNLRLSQSCDNTAAQRSYLQTLSALEFGVTIPQVWQKLNRLPGESSFLKEDSRFFLSVRKMSIWLVPSRCEASHPVLAPLNETEVEANYVGVNNV